MNYNDFTIIKMLGKGTYSDVFLATNKNDNKYYAMKAVNHFKEGEDFPQTAIREIYFLQKLRHPNILNLVSVVYDNDFIDQKGFAYLVLDYCPHDLDSLLHSPYASNYIDEAQIKGLLLQMFNGLKFMHDNGIIHRDLKRLVPFK